ncbi:MAG: hypothetical protein AAFW75_25325 [Cyanobacteria bacterium J06636_16]
MLSKKNYRWISKSCSGESILQERRSLDLVRTKVILDGISKFKRIAKAVETIQQSVVVGIGVIPFIL